MKPVWHEGTIEGLWNSKVTEGMEGGLDHTGELAATWECVCSWEIPFIPFNRRHQPGLRAERQVTGVGISRGLNGEIRCFCSLLVYHIRRSRNTNFGSIVYPPQNALLCIIGNLRANIFWLN